MFPNIFLIHEKKTDDIFGTWISNIRIKNNNLFCTYRIRK